MRFPLTTIQADANRVAQARSCGPCTACCVLPRISADKETVKAGIGPKLGYEPCVKLCENGCSVYEDRPNVCRNYTCLWRDGVVAGDERRRPDNLGVMFTLDVFGSRGLVIEAWELWEGGIREHPGRGVVNAIAQHAPMTLRFYGVPCSVRYTGPGVLDLGRELSRMMQRDPRAVGEWVEDKLADGSLVAPTGVTPDEMGFWDDVEAIKAGWRPQAHFAPK